MAERYEDNRNDVVVCRRNEWTLGELHAAFDRVKHPGNWKMPILAIVPARDVELISDAVEFFTGSECHERPMGPVSEIKADGYYVAIGA